jgi:F0F1-type ATP synthase assembly protein I
VPGPPKPPAASYAEYTALALLLPASTFVGYLIGYWLDRLFHTHFLYIVLLILGSVGGFVQLIRQVMRDARDE